MSDFVQIGALWKAKEGSRAILSGKLGNANLMIFPNEYKKEDKQPDYVVCVSKPVKRGQEETKKEDFPF